MGSGGVCPGASGLVWAMRTPAAARSTSVQCVAVCRVENCLLGMILGCLRLGGWLPLPIACLAPFVETARL